MNGRASRNFFVKSLSGTQVCPFEPKGIKSITITYGDVWGAAKEMGPCVGRNFQDHLIWLVEMVLERQSQRSIFYSDDVTFNKHLAHFFRNFL